MITNEDWQTLYDTGRRVDAYIRRMTAISSKVTSFQFDADPLIELNDREAMDGEGYYGHCPFCPCPMATGHGIYL